MALVESKHEHSSRSSLEAQAYRSLGLTLGGVAREDILEQNQGGSKACGPLVTQGVKRWWERTLEELFARRERVQVERVQVGYEKRRNDEDSFKALKNQILRLERQTTQMEVLQL